MNQFTLLHFAAEVTQEGLIDEHVNHFCMVSVDAQQMREIANDWSFNFITFVTMQLHGTADVITNMVETFHRSFSRGNLQFQTAAMTELPAPRNPRVAMSE